ncbi:MAG: tetratricopeptide repeat protein [Prolixibacteraceae bacterium]
MKEQLIQFLDGLQQVEITETHAKGFTYFQHGFMPRLLEAGKIKGFNKTILAAGWTRAGAIYALNEAPSRSMECLRKALVLVPLNSAALNLYIDQLILTGAYHEAFRHINELLDVEPNNMELFTKRQRIQDDMNYDAEAKFQKGDVIWELNEQLAGEQFSSVINTVLETEMDDFLLLKKLACAYGAVGHNANYIQVMETIERLEGPVNLEYVDVFYRPLMD